LREWTLKIRQTVFSVVDDGHGKVKREISTLTLLHEHALVISAGATLNAKVNAWWGIDQH
jgi:hypothetical protein